MTTITLTDNQSVVLVCSGIFLLGLTWCISWLLHTSEKEDKASAFDFMVALATVFSFVLGMITLFIIAFGGE